MPDPDEDRAIVDRERDQDVGGARLQEGVSERADAVQAERRETGVGRLLVERRGRLARLGRLDQAVGEREAEERAGRDQDQFDDARGAAEQPPGVDLGVHTKWTSPSSVISTPPWRLSHLWAPPGPLNSAALASASASSPVVASAVTLISPVQAGAPVEG